MEFVFLARVIYLNNTSNTHFWFRLPLKQNTGASEILKIQSLVENI